jgi:hypothetical protein
MRERSPGENGHGAADVVVEMTAPHAALVQVEQLAELLKKMPEQYQNIMLLRLAGHDVPDVAEIVGCCERTVYRAQERFAELAREADSP